MPSIEREIDFEHVAPLLADQPQHLLVHLDQSLGLR
jgi:hypothetical protein